VDINPAKLGHAKECGADVVIDSSKEDCLAAVTRVARGGVDIAIDATGSIAVGSNLLSLVRNQGGTAVVIGNVPSGTLLQIDPRQLNAGKQLRGTWGGDNEPATDFPRYQALLAGRRMSLGHILGSTYALDQINLALDHLECGSVVRPLIICNE
jgi:Zn-dependent alcohol dehydrogenase